MIGYAARKKKELDKELNIIRHEIKYLQRAHKTQTNSKGYKELQEAKLKLDSLLIKKADDYKYNSTKINYIAANKSGKHLSSLIKRVLKRQPITLKDETLSKTHINNQDINDKFRMFHEKLCKGCLKSPLYKAI